MTATAADRLPGFRRRFRVEPAPGRVLAALEDDYHCMAVVVHHDSGIAHRVDADMQRAPWTTCPGAEKQLAATFAGAALVDFPARGGKKANCTHLYDLALLAARYAEAEDRLQFDILVSDPVRGRISAELHRDGACLMQWTVVDAEVVAPEDFRGLGLYGNLGPWIDALPLPLREAAKMLRWGCMMAHGRQIPLDQQSDASAMPANCYTFQPERAVIADRVGLIKDFSDGSEEPLEAFQSAL